MEKFIGVSFDRGVLEYQTMSIVKEVFANFVPSGLRF